MQLSTRSENNIPLRLERENLYNDRIEKVYKNGEYNVSGAFHRTFIIYPRRERLKNRIDQS